MLARHRREESVMMREVEEGTLYRCSLGPVMIPSVTRVPPSLAPGRSFALSFDGQALGLVKEVMRDKKGRGQDPTLSLSQLFGVELSPVFGVSFGVYTLDPAHLAA